MDKRPFYKRFLQVSGQIGGFFRAIGSHKNFFLSEMYFKNIFLKFIIKKVIIKWNNFFYSKLDDFIKFDKDTLGYNVVAKKVIGG